MYFLFIVLLAVSTVHGYCGTLSPHNRPEHKFCLLSSNTIAVRHFDDDTCTPIIFNVHKHNDNLVLNFKNRDYICNFLCIDKCGQVYHESVFYTEDCVLTTSALEHIETLSVHRGNYSDFFAANEYYLTALSMQPGDSVQRQHNLLALKFDYIQNTDILCPLMLEPAKTTHKCYTEQTRDDHNKYINRRHYRDYSFWEKLLIFFGITKYVVPTNTTHMLSYLEYSTV